VLRVLGACVCMCCVYCGCLTERVPSPLPASHPTRCPPWAHAHAFMPRARASSMHMHTHAQSHSQTRSHTHNHTHARAQATRCRPWAPTRA
jgi:hypothetical protein